MARVFVVGTGDAGGIGRYERLLVRALDTAPEVELATAWRRPHPGYLGQIAPGAPAEPVGLPRFAAAALRRIAAFKPDVVVFTTVNVARLGLALRLLRPGTRYVVCIHGIEAWRPMPANLRAALVRADRVVASASYNVERLVENQGVERARIATIPLSLEPEWLEAAERDRATALVRGRILTVSRLSSVDSYKGIDSTIDALPVVAERVPEASYRVVGEGDDEPRLRTLAAERGVDGRVHFAGAVAHEALLDEYRACELFAMPSKGEGFGLVLLEAMAFGKPVVASALGGPLDVVDDGVTGVLVRDDAELADALAGLLADPARAAEMGERGRERAREQFGFERYAEHWSRLVTGAGEPEEVREPCAA